MDAELAKAKECAKKKDKLGALMALKRKKLWTHTSVETLVAWEVAVRVFPEFAFPSETHLR